MGGPVGLWGEPRTTGGPGVPTVTCVTIQRVQDRIALLGGATDIEPALEARSRRRGVRIDVHDLTRRVRVGTRGEVTLVDRASFTISAGELVAIVGPSGAGKTSLMEAIAGVAPVPAISGSVRFDGIDLHDNLDTFRSVLGYVPQDDIIHTDLPLARTLRYAAQLRLPSSARASEIDDTVRDALDAVGLTAQAELRVGSLSGGQRKRASIAAELLTDPHVFFLDEPTSGLDPSRVPSWSPACARWPTGRRRSSSPPTRSMTSRGVIVSCS